MSNFLMPKGMVRVITSIQKIFLWSSASDVRNINKVHAWNVVVREKGRGSLGIGSLQGKNKALLFKWLWRLGDQNRGGWQDIIIRNYQPIFNKDFLFSINRFKHMVRYIFYHASIMKGKSRHL